MKKEIGIHFGVFDSISSQLKKQGFEFDKKIVKEFQHQQEQILHLWFADLLNDKEKLKALERLMKKITIHVKEQNK